MDHSLYQIPISHYIRLRGFVLAFSPFVCVMHAHCTCIRKDTNIETRWCNLFVTDQRTKLPRWTTDNRHRPTDVRQKTWSNRHQAIFGFCPHSYLQLFVANHHWKLHHHFSKFFYVWESLFCFVFSTLSLLAIHQPIRPVPSMSKTLNNWLTSPS